MAVVKAKQELQTFRCGAEGCNKVLFEGSFEGTIKKVCKCGAENVLVSTEGKINHQTKPYQQRMGRRTK